jgi:hypothetical protein
MRDSLALTIILYASGMTVWAAAQVVRGGRRNDLLTAALVILELGLLVQAVLDLMSIAGGTGRLNWRRIWRTWSHPSWCSPSWCPSAEKAGRAPS